MTADGARPAGRPRGRPRNDGPRPPLTREAITDAAVRVVADRGFAALTMRTLADALDVTVRALYRHVADRQDVVDLIAARIMALQPERTLDAADWRGSIRTLYRGTRQAYRQIGRAVLFPFEETVTPVELPTERILRPERLLVFLTDLGLPLVDALVWHQQLLTDVFGFVLVVDHQHDHGVDRQGHALLHPAPEPWLDAHPEVPAPLSRRALRLPALSTDELFERTIDRAILAVEVGRDRPASS